MYCMQDASSIHGDNAEWTALHFSGKRFKLKMAHKLLQVGDMAGKDIKFSAKSWKGV